MGGKAYSFERSHAIGATGAGTAGAGAKRRTAIGAVLMRFTGRSGNNRLAFFNIYKGSFIHTGQGALYENNKGHYECEKFHQVQK